MIPIWSLIIFFDNLSYLLKLFYIRKELLFNFSSFSLGLKFLDLFFDNLKNCFLIIFLFSIFCVDFSILLQFKLLSSFNLLFNFLFKDKLFEFKLILFIISEVLFI